MVKFNDFIKSPIFQADLGETFCAICFDKSGNGLWISDGYCLWTGFNSLTEIRRETLFTEIQSEEGNTIHGKIRVNSNTPSDTPLNIVRTYGHMIKEGLPASVAVTKYSDFDLYVMRPMPLSVSNTFLFYQKEMYAYVDKEEKIVELNRTMAAKLRSVDNTRKMVGSRISDYIIKKDWQEWKKARVEFEKYIEKSAKQAQGIWESLFDSEKQKIKLLPEKNIIVKENHLSLSNIVARAYALVNKKLDHISHDVRVEADLINNSAAIILYSSEYSEKSPDENGYLAEFNKTTGNIELRRNYYIIAKTKHNFISNSVAVEKNGGCIRLYSGGELVLSHNDVLPLKRSREQCRVGFFLENGAGVTNIKILNRKSIFDYDKVDEYRQLVRFKDYPESALYMIGTTGEAKRKARPEPHPDPGSNPQPEVEHGIDTHES